MKRQDAKTPRRKQRPSNSLRQIQAVVLVVVIFVGGTFVREKLIGGRSNPRKQSSMKRIITAAIGLFGVLVGVGLVLPALARVRDLGAMPSESLVPYTLGIALVAFGISLTAFSLIKRKAA
jgi:hypothetical protein